MIVSKISKEEREEISRLLAQGHSCSEIGRRIGRHKSTVSREIKGRGMTATTYRAFRAGMDARMKKSNSGRRSKLESNTRLKKVVVNWLRLKWSPEQIMERLKKEYPEEEDMRITHETIYRYLYVHPKEKLRRELICNLRRNRKIRKKQKTEGYVEKRGKIPNMISIDDRPKQVEGRQIPGHWEGDLILGKEKKTAMGTLNERSTRFTILVRLDKDKYNAVGVREAFAKAFESIPEELKRSLTYDQGREMKEHKLFTEETKVDVYFAHTSSPWERGTNENTNSLIRQYFPKGIDLSDVTEEEVQMVQQELNDRPRKCLSFRKPNEVFQDLLR
jgi:IS30 family transposase